MTSSLSFVSSSSVHFGPSGISNGPLSLSTTCYTETAFLKPEPQQILDSKAFFWLFTVKNKQKKAFFLNSLQLQTLLLLCPSHLGCLLQQLHLYRHLSPPSSCPCLLLVLCHITSPAHRSCCLHAHNSHSVFVYCLTAFEKFCFFVFILWLFSSLFFLFFPHPSPHCFFSPFGYVK